MHHIQQKILSRLLYAKSLSYAQMRPSGVESNHYAYHLEQLVHAGFIVKHERGYSLSLDGLALADRLSHDTLTVRMQPHIVTSVYVTNDAGQMVLYKHAFQPYLDLFGALQGRTHYEEHVAAAATRELAEKTGLHNVKLTHRGVVYIHATKDDHTVSKILAHVFTGTVTGTPELAPATAKGGCVWTKAARLRKGQCMPGFKEILKLLAHSEEFIFAELETTLA